MAIIIENGTGLSNAQAYASAAEFNAYMTERSQTHSYSAQAIEGALVAGAKDWIDGQHEFANSKLVETQALKFPRTVFEFPASIKIANIKAALLHLQGALLVDTTAISTGGDVESKTEKVGELSESVTYRNGTSQTYSRVVPLELTNLLRPYLFLGDGYGVRW